MELCGFCQQQDQQAAEEAAKDFLDYDGDEYLSRPFFDGETVEDARRAAQDRRFLRICIELDGLEHILKDKWASKGLLDALLKNDPGVLFSLRVYASERLAMNPPARKRQKPGPKRDPKTRKYKHEVIAELDKQGLKSGQIARQVYGNPKLGNRVLAHLSRLRRVTKVDQQA
jgi:hypothetical protein